MKKIFNFRPMVFFAIFLIVGVISVTYFISMRISLAAFIVIASVLAIALVLSIIFMTAMGNKFVIKRLGKRLLLCAVAVVIGGASVSVTYGVQTRTYIEKDTYSITARVCEVPVANYDANYLSLVLDDIMITKGKDSYNLPKNLKVYFSGDNIRDNLEIGNVIKFSAKIYSVKMTDINEIGRDYYYLANDIYYSGSAKSEIEVLDEYRINIFEKIRLKAKDILDSNLSEDYSAIGYGMFFGEDAYISSELSNTFTDAGISHLLAVSGLHIGFVVLLLSSLFSLLHVNEKTSSIILIACLFFYVVLCEFTPSVVRAFIMTTCMLLSKLTKKPYDGLSALSLAAIIILLFSPLDLFTASFQLSFMAVLGILLLFPVFNKFFSKFLFEQFASSLSLSLAASIGIMPIMALSFEKFSALSVFTNMIVIPIASIAFMILFAAVIISMIVPSISIIVVAFEFLMRFVTAVAAVAASAWVNLYHVNVGSAFLFLVLGVSAIISEYVQIKRPYKFLIIMFILKCVALYYIVDFALILLL